MRRFLSLFTMMMLSAVLSFAQSRLVTGRVSDEAGKPVPFASVVIRGGGGVQTDVNGEYSIRVSPGDVLQISQTSYDMVEIPVGSLTNINTTLKLKDNTIAEVVVTSAFNTKRTARSVSSNVQNVNAEQLNTVRAANVNNALAGKVAGAQVRSQSAVALGRETTVRLRGENGLGTGSGPLYVVDGTILPSSGDINPDDVADITVLQGPAAAALFGPEGSNGAIVINTKKGRKNAPGIGIEINSGVTFDKVYLTPNFQNSYSGGSGSDMIKFEWQAGMPTAWQALDGKYYHNYDDDASWGPRMSGQEYIPWYAWYGGHERSYQTAKLTPQPTNATDFYNKGVTLTNNISFSKATDNMNLRVSYTNLDVKGLIPTQYLKKHTLNTNFSMDLSPKINLSSSITFINQDRNADLDDGYANQSSGSFNQWFHRDLDINILRELRGLQTPEGIYASWNISNPTSYSATNPKAFYAGNYWYNPYTYFDLIKSFDQRNRLFGDIGLTYKFSNDFRVKATYRRQQLTTNGYNIYPTELEVSGNQTGFNPYGETTAESQLAAYQTGETFSNRQYYEGLATYTKKVRDFNFNGNAGFVIYKSTARTFNANTSGGLSVPGVYALGNSVNRIRNAGTNNFESITNYKSRGVFVRADVGYKNFAFIEGSFRKDYTSAEPAGKPIDTKSLGASLVFTDLLPKSSILSYGKVRASWGQILNPLSAYDLLTSYTTGASFNGSATMGEPNTLVDPLLHGAFNDEKEIGLDLRFLKNRIGTSITYWDRTNKDFPVAITTSGASGYTAIRTNAGEIAKKGIDVQLNARVLNLPNLEWDINATWGYLLKNEVVSIAKDGSIQRLVSANGSYGPTTTNPLSAWTVSEIGLPWGQLHGTGIERIDGKPVLNEDGTYVSAADVNYGSVLPKYTGGVQNSFNVLKNFVVNVNIDYSVGGKFFSLSNFWGDFSGLTARTAALNDKGNSVRDAVEDGGGVHVTGVDASGKAMDMYVDAQTYFHQFYSSKISEKNVYDLTYVKLRELSLGYRLPISRIGNLSKYLQGATFSIIARNPALLYSKTRDFDPSEISGVQGEDGQMPGTRSLGVNLKLNF
ncbi:MAG: SusC/RagA family TonB-linked outer membrane protein [Ferruginibacter sp.]